MKHRSVPGPLDHYCKRSSSTLSTELSAMTQLQVHRLALNGQEFIILELLLHHDKKYFVGATTSI